MTREEAKEFIAQSVKSDVDMALVADAIEALEQAPTTKNASKFCPDRKAKTTNMETILHCIENECVAYKDGKCLKYNSDQEPTTENNLGVDAISRQAVLELIADYDLSMGQVVRGIYALPSVTPQEPVIDKIRAEIEQLPTEKCTETCGIRIDADVFKENVLAILGKYKAESEK